MQAKLSIGEAGDALEREADAVADEVMRAPARSPAQKPAAAILQRRASSSAPPSGEAPPLVHAALASPGRPLDDATRGSMEARFAHDFSGVRVHTDADAAMSARAVDAQAYTVGQDVVFDRSRYAPSSATGQRLLAHELAHTIQQENGQRLQRAPGNGGSTTTAQATGNCSVAQGSALTAAIASAIQWLHTAIQSLHGYEALPLSRGAAATRSALRFHFHTTNPFHAALIRTRLQQVLDGLESPQGAPSDCAAAGAGCGAATVAYHQHGQVFWCPFLFELDAPGQAKTVVHEYAHAQARRLALGSGFAAFSDGTPRRIEDRAYLDRRYYLDLTPSEAMDNADSYANLVEDLGTGTASTQQPSERAEDKMPGCSPAQQELIRESLSMIHRWNDATVKTLNDSSLPSFQILDQEVTDAIQTRFGARAPARADLAAVYEAASTPLLLGFSLACDGATGACQSPAVQLWQSGTGGAIHVCPGWIARADALERHRHLYTQVLSNAGAVSGNPWSYVDLARDLEGLHLEINEPPPPVPEDPFPQSTVPGTAIG